jgi:hypothetical protein
MNGIQIFYFFIASLFHMMMMMMMMNPVQVLQAIKTGIRYIGENDCPKNGCDIGYIYIYIITSKYRGTICPSILPTVEAVEAV